MNKRPLLRWCGVLFFAASSPWAHAAPEASWVAAEYERVGRAGYQMVVDAGEAASLDQPGSGWRRTGAILHTFDYPEGDFNVPVCRVSTAGRVAYAIGAAACQRPWSAYGAQAPNTFYLAKAGPSGACTSGLAVWALPDTTNAGLLARIGVGEPVPGMGIAKNQLVWGLCAPKTARMRRMDAARLLDQATFGATASAIDVVADTIGIKRWIETQLAMAASRYTQYPTYYRPVGFFDPNCTFNLADGTQAPAAIHRCASETFTPELVQREFFWQATEGQDQLRQRVAWAWSQLFVVSNVKEGMAYGTADYQQKLRDLAFSRFEDLLYMVSTHPMMGRMLDNIGNAKASGSRGPTENFARELLQLFTTGTVRLNPDGSPVLGGDGLPVPLYGQDTVSELARAVTGWVEAPSTPPEGRMRGNLRDPMVPFSVSQLPFPNAPNAELHDPGAKRIFGGELMIPAGLGAEAEMRLVVKFLADHPNTAVFISRYLIQRLVTSNPSGAYLERVVDTFRNNGNGVVGDMRAVVTAILLDPEARGALRPEENYGRLRDNVQRYVGLLRAINARGFKGQEVQLPWSMNANPFNAPSVFGYFLAEHRLAPGLYGPEFNANRASSVLDWASRSAQLVAQDIQNWNQQSPVAGSSDVSGYVSTASNVAGLIDHLNMTFAGGSMSPAMRDAMSSMLGDFRPWGGPPTQEFVARSALFLFFNSAQYHVQR